MGLFDAFKKRPAAPVESEEELYVQEQKTNIVAKCKNGAAMENLNPVERVTYIALKVQDVITTEGFAGYFAGYALYADEIVQVYSEIGAPQMAKICQIALAVRAGQPCMPGDKYEDDVFAEVTERERYALCDDFFHDANVDDDLINCCYEYLR